MTNEKFYKVVTAMKKVSDEYNVYRERYAKDSRSINLNMMNSLNEQLTGMWTVVSILITEDEEDKLVEWLNSDIKPTWKNAREYFENN